MARSTGFQIAVQMRVAPSHEVKHLAYLYTRAKQLIVNWLVETKPTFKDGNELLTIIHHEWSENPRKNKSKPRIKSISAVLTPKASYNMNLKRMRLTILGYETQILGKVERERVQNA